MWRDITHHTWRVMPYEWLTHMWHESSHMTWPIRDMTHLHVTWLFTCDVTRTWHDSFTCDMILHMRRDPYVTWLIHMWHDSLHMTWPIRDMTHSHVTWLVTCDVTQTWHDSCHMWHDSSHMMWHNACHYVKDMKLWVMGAATHVNSHVSCEWVMSRINEACHIWMSHIHVKQQVWYRAAKTHRMPSVAGHFPQKSL